jgi:benzoyl-CoA 2,3-dioxygenase component A
MSTEATLIKQHLIDPEICIRCNTCESICPVGAITHDSRNYVVDVNTCNWCNDCISPCPTGSIDNYRKMPRSKAYSLQDQFGWDELPAELSAAELAALAGDAGDAPAAEPGRPGRHPGRRPHRPDRLQLRPVRRHAAALVGRAPLHQPVRPESARKDHHRHGGGNVRVTGVGKEYDTHHIVLDFGHAPFPVLEGQSIGIIPPGTDGRQGRAHHARQYSVASPRNGERPGYNNLSLTVKRVLEDHQGHPVRGVGSNYMCDLKVGDKVQVIGPFGASFLMPNHPRSHIVMICTGTGSAPMRAMTEWRRRLRQSASSRAAS